MTTGCDKRLRNMATLCGDWHYGEVRLCPKCLRAATRAYPQGWAYCPGDTCIHGTYVGGCGVDYICHRCEMDYETIARATVRGRERAVCMILSPFPEPGAEQVYTWQVVRGPNSVPVKSESAFWYELKLILRARGYDVVKRLLSQDDHMMDEEGVTHYLRERKWRFAIYDPSWAIESVHKKFNRHAEVELQIAFARSYMLSHMRVKEEMHHEKEQ